MIIIPILVTFACLFMAFKPYTQHGDYDLFTPLIRMLWFIPIGFIWAAYFGLVLLYNIYHFN
jgi:hypothetical protein